MQRRDMSTLTVDNDALTERCLLNEGSSRMEIVVDRLQEDLIQQKQWSIQNNLIIHNIPKSEGEDLHVKLSDFFRSLLLISSEVMDKMQVHIIHRMGFKRNAKFCRPLIINEGPLSSATLNI